DRRAYRVRGVRATARPHAHRAGGGLPARGDQPQPRCRGAAAPARLHPRLSAARPCARARCPRRRRTGRHPPGGRSRRRDRPAPRGRPVTGRRAVGAALLVVSTTTMSGCDWKGLNSLPLPGTAGGGPDGYSVAVQLADVTTLDRNARVRVGDVTVGRIADI